MVIQLWTIEKCKECGEDFKKAIKRFKNSYGIKSRYNNVRHFKCVTCCKKCSRAFSLRKTKERHYIERFNKKCICLWSKNDKYGFIPYSDCPVHGKRIKELLKRARKVEI